MKSWLNEKQEEEWDELEAWTYVIAGALLGIFFTWFLHQLLTLNS